MLLSLTLSNWRSHAKTKLDFARGTNLFLGQMGAGKSSAVDALCFALYGTYPKIQRRDVSFDDVANFRHPQDGVFVELEWKGGAGGEDCVYKVRREIGKKAEAWLWKDGKLAQKGPKAVSAQIENELGIDYDLFARAAYSEQNRMDYWLSLPPSVRKGELDRLLGLDAFEGAKEGCVKETSRIRALAEAAEAQAKPESIDAAKAKLANAAAAEEGAKKEGETAALDLEARASDAKRLSEAFGAEEAKRKKSAEFSSRIAALDGRMGALKVQAESAGNEDVGKIEAELAAARNARIAAQDALAKIEKEAMSARAEEGRLDGAMRAAAEKAKKRAELISQLAKLLGGMEFGALEAKREQITGERKDGQALLASCEAELKAILSSSKALEDSKGGACPVCGNELDGEHRARLGQEKKEAMARLDVEKAKLSARLKKLDDELRLAQNSVEHAGRIRAQLGTLEETAQENFAEKLAVVRGQIAKLREDAALEKKRADAAREKEGESALKLQKINDAKKAGVQLDATRLEKEKVASEMAALGFDEKKWAEAGEANSAAQKAHAACIERSRSIGRIVAQAAQLREAALHELAASEAKVAEARALRAQMDELSSFRNVLAATQAEVRAQLLDELNAALSRLWPMLYPYGDWKGVRILGGEKDYGFEVWQGEWKGLEAFASGGERASVALAVRVALSLMLTPNLGWLVLDEPTHNLDSRAVVSLGEALAVQLPKIIPQAIVITHDAALVESTPSRVFRFERDKAGAEDTQVAAE